MWLTSPHRILLWRPPFSKGMKNKGEAGVHTNLRATASLILAESTWSRLIHWLTCSPLMQGLNLLPAVRVSLGSPGEDFMRADDHSSFFVAVMILSVRPVRVSSGELARTPRGTWRNLICRLRAATLPVRNVGAHTLTPILSLLLCCFCVCWKLLLHPSLVHKQAVAQEVHGYLPVSALQADGLGVQVLAPSFPEGTFAFLLLLRVANHRERCKPQRLCTALFCTVPAGTGGAAARGAEGQDRLPDGRDQRAVFLQFHNQRAPRSLSLTDSNGH